MLDSDRCVQSKHQVFSHLMPGVVVDGLFKCLRRLIVNVLALIPDFVRYPIANTSNYSQFSQAFGYYVHINLKGKTEAGS